MNLIAVRFAAFVIIASSVPLPQIGAQGQNVITSSITDGSWRFFPCASGVIEKRERARVKKDQPGTLIKAGDKKRSRRAEGRL